MLSSLLSQYSELQHYKHIIVFIIDIVYLYFLYLRLYYCISPKMLYIHLVSHPAADFAERSWWRWAARRGHFFGRLAKALFTLKTLWKFAGKTDLCFLFGLLNLHQIHNQTLHPAARIFTRPHRPPVITQTDQKVPLKTFLASAWSESQIYLPHPDRLPLKGGRNSFHFKKIWLWAEHLFGLFS